MTYTAWSVIFGEQPSAAKWNQLGSNDAHFYSLIPTYSASETDTGLEWTDGRTIYRKVLSGNVNLAVGANNIAHNITGISSLEIVNMSGGIRLGTTSRGTSVSTFWHHETGGHWVKPTAVDDTNIVYTGTFAWGNSAYTIILEYVK